MDDDVVAGENTELRQQLVAAQNLLMDGGLYPGAF